MSLVYLLHACMQVLTFSTCTNNPSDRLYCTAYNSVLSLVLSSLGLLSGHHSVVTVEGSYRI